MVESAVMASYASDQRATRNAIPAETQTATCGLRKREETEAICREKGSPPSRADAKSMREFEVTLESPQNHIAANATQTRAFPRTGPNPPRSTKMKGLSAARAAWRSPMLSVTASSIAYPATPLTATARTMPQGALRDGSWVSSLTCALASYPVNVQQARSRPTPNS